MESGIEIVQMSLVSEDLQTSEDSVHHEQFYSSDKFFGLFFPSHITADDLISKDNPYAKILGMQLSFQNEGEIFLSFSFEL